MGGQNANPAEKHDPVRDMTNRHCGNKKKALDAERAIREVYLIQFECDFDRR